MSSSLKYPSGKTGLGPGSLVHVGDVHEPVTRLAVVSYNQNHYEQHSVVSPDEITAYRNNEAITWVIVEGLSDASVIEKIGEQFGIHSLVLEDILNTHQRPKLEENENYLFVVLKCLMPNEDSFSVNYEQVSMLVLDNIIFTFREKTDPLLEPVLKRLEKSHGRARSAGPDFLMYAILDTIIDQNFEILDQLDETLVSLEAEIFSNSNPTLPAKIHELKMEVIRMRRYLAPIRDMTAGLLRSESALIHEHTVIYLRDVHDHVLRIIESIEIHRDILSSLLEIYLSSISGRLNEVMKVLTIFASVFIPLTFIAGIYGMNFEHMPELKWAWGYPAIWGVFISTTAGLLYYFRRKGWI
jgi:magnesium transporter